MIVHCRRSRDAAEAVAESVRHAGGRSCIIMADLKEDGARRALAEEAWGTWDGLDVLVNNAGADTLTGEAAHWSFERKLEELLAVDVTATMTLVRDLGRRMKPTQGVIVNMGWDQAETGMEGDSGELFAAAKGAVIAFSRSLALSLAPEVRVHCLAPGWIRTAWGEHAIRCVAGAGAARDAVTTLGTAGGCGGGGAVSRVHRRRRISTVRSSGSTAVQCGEAAGSEALRVEPMCKPAAVDVESGRGS